MPSIPEESENCDHCSNNTNMERVREITQTDHLNKKLLTSYLNSINMSDASEKSNGVDKTQEQDEDQEEDQNWES